MVPLLYFTIMIDLLYKLDYQILIFINQTLSNSPFDFIMPFFDDIKNWIPFISNLLDFLNIPDYI